MLVNLVYVTCQVKNKAFCLTVSELIIFNISQIHVPLLTLPEFIVVKILQIHVGPKLFGFILFSTFVYILTLAFLCSQSKVQGCYHITLDAYSTPH